jgi:hypothetical protein
VAQERNKQKKFDKEIEDEEVIGRVGGAGDVWDVCDVVWILSDLQSIHLSERGRLRNADNGPIEGVFDFEY